MECLSSLVLLFAALKTPTAAPILTTLMLLTWHVKRMRPCLFCAVVMYAIMVSVILFEGSQGNLFEALRLSPSEMELNLLLRVKYDVTLGLGRSPPSDSLVFAPLEGFGNFFKAFLRYLLEPNYGKIYRQ